MHMSALHLSVGQCTRLYTCSPTNPPCRAVLFCANAHMSTCMSGHTYAHTYARTRAGELPARCGAVPMGPRQHNLHPSAEVPRRPSEAVALRLCGRRPWAITDGWAIGCVPYAIGHRPRPRDPCAMGIGRGRSPSACADHWLKIDPCFGHRPSDDRPSGTGRMPYGSAASICH